MTVITDAEISSVALASSVSFPAGHILQTKQTVKTDKEAVTSSNTTKDVFAFIPAQGGSGVFQENITTTGSNKVLIQVHLTLSANNGYSGFWAIFRGTATDTAIGSCTKIAVGTEPSSAQSTGTSMWGGVTNVTMSQSMSWLDSPGAGTFFYKIGWNGENGATIRINRNVADQDSYYVASMASTITLLEVQV